MWANVKKGLFPFIIAFSALSVSGSAAFYSVYGLSKLFAGAQIEVIIMAGSLEVAKLVIASLLYQYWDTINKILRTYLTLAAVILVLITSMGIYGFLSAAYQETYANLLVNENKIEFLDEKSKFYEDDLQRYDKELEQISSNISILSNAKASSIQVRDTTVSGGVRSTISTAELRLSQARIEVEEENRKSVQEKRQVAADSLQSIKLEILTLNNDSETVGELGPLKYLSGLTSTPMDVIINILLLVIIFVFDPLAIALVVAANFAFTQLRPKKDKFEFLHEEEIDNPEYKEWEEATINDGLEEEDWETVDEEPQIEVKMSGEPSLSMLNEEIEGVPVMFDPKTGKFFYQTETPPEQNKEQPLENQLTEEETKYDLNNDGILDEQERAKYEEEKLLNNPGISEWRKKKIRDYLEGKTKKYW